MDLIEIQFPDLTVARYPRDRVIDLIASQKVRQHWLARLKGTEEWFSVEHLIGHPAPQAVEHIVPAPKSQPGLSGGVEDAAPSRFRVEPLTQMTPEVKVGPAAQNFLENKETVIASIGQNSLVGFLKGEGLAMTNIILTDKRIYGRGKVIDRSISAEGWLVGDVSAISAVALFKASDWKKLAFGICLFFVALMSSKFSSLVAACVFMVGTAFVILYFSTRRKFYEFTVDFAQYCFAFRSGFLQLC